MQQCSLPKNKPIHWTHSDLQSCNPVLTSGPESREQRCSHFIVLDLKRVKTDTRVRVTLAPHPDLKRESPARQPHLFTPPNTMDSNHAGTCRKEAWGKLSWSICVFLELELTPSFTRVHSPGNDQNSKPKDISPNV